MRRLAEGSRSTLTNGLDTAIESLLCEFMDAVTRRSRRLINMDLRDNGWSLSHQGIIADALDAASHRDPPFEAFRLA